jgi:hypothetical protein
VALRAQVPPMLPRPAMSRDDGARPASWVPDAPAGPVAAGERLPERAPTAVAEAAVAEAAVAVAVAVAEAAVAAVAAGLSPLGSCSPGPAARCSDGSSEPRPRRLLRMSSTAARPQRSDRPV